MQKSTIVARSLHPSSDVVPGGPGSAARPAAGSAARVQVDAGSSGNTNLPNFAVSVGLTDLEAPNGVGVDQPEGRKKSTAPQGGPIPQSVGDLAPVNLGFSLSVLHLSFDTVEWNLALSDAQLGLVAPLLPAMVGAGEQVDSSYSFVVTRKGGLTHHYRMAFTNGFAVELPSEGFSRYGLRVIANSKACLVSENLTADALAVLAYVLGLSSDELAPSLSVSRADVCLDVQMPDSEFQRFCKQVSTLAPAVVTRARKVSPHLEDGRYTGVSLGEGAIRFRVYDKKLEAVQGGDWNLWATVYGRGSAFDVPDGQAVARFEWQLRRGFLKQCCLHGVDLEQHADCSGLRTLEDFRSSSADVLGYLTGDWFRLAGAARGKNHVRPLRPFWRAIRAGFLTSAWSSFSGSFRRRLRGFVSTNLEKLRDMAAGCLATIAAAEGHLAGFGRGVSARIALKKLEQHIDRQAEKWKDGRDRRYKALAYSKRWRAVPV